MKLKRLALLILVVVLPTSALAHIGDHAGIQHGSAFIMGLAHPFTGLDHLVAMLVVGMWSMLACHQAQRGVWVAPVAFAGFLLVGGLLGFYGIDWHMAEPMIAASLLVFGLLVALRVRLPLVAGALIAGAFAVFHGVAHGGELPASRAAAALSGMVLGSMILHISGMLIARFVLQRNVWLPRIVGGVVAMLGAGLLGGTI